MNPGSQEAKAKGCLCPIMDNRWGKGYAIDKDGKPVFVIRTDCPIHGEDPFSDPAGDFDERNADVEV